LRLKANNLEAIAQRKSDATAQAALLQAVIASQPAGATNGSVLPPSSHKYWDSKLCQTNQTSVQMIDLVPGSTSAYPSPFLLVDSV
jgi:hypothetical protein